MSLQLPLYDDWLGKGSRYARLLNEALHGKAGAPRLLEAMAYTADSGGKAFRPYLVHASAAAFGGDIKLACEPAVAVELVHSYSLIHDDLPAMDDDDMRRGRPSNHKVYGEAMAMLAGDALQSLAFETLCSDHYIKEAGGARVARLAWELATASGASGMAGGQALDMSRDIKSAEEVAAMHDMKTGALILFCLRAGSIIAKGEADDSVDRLGKAIGRAFQVRDDILDVTSTAGQLGKTPGKDAAQGKATYVSAFGLCEAKAKLTALADEAQSITSGLSGDTSALAAAIELLRA